MARQVKRHFLQQAHTFKANKYKIVGALMSEKLDGQRAFWDGGITRGLPATEVPWANTAKDKKIRIATGLWSRYGKPIHAPNWWLDLMPKFPLDGELWIERGAHQQTRSIVSRHVPNENDWKLVKFMAFDSPQLMEIFYDSIIDIPNYYKELSGVSHWLHSRGASLLHKGNFGMSFGASYDWLCKNLPQCQNLFVLTQYELPNDKEKANSLMQGFYEDIVSDGGEGVVLRKQDAIYLPERTHEVLKMKPRNDAEATVVGYVTGRQTDKGSKLLGLMGALVVNFKGKIFELSGFTDTERVLIDEPLLTISTYEAETYARRWAEAHPETACPVNIVAKHFPIGSQVTFKYRELSDDGIPKEAAYWRKR